MTRKDTQSWVRSLPLARVLCLIALYCADVNVFMLTALMTTGNRFTAG